MGRTIDENDLPLPKRLEGMRRVLAYVFEEAAAFGQCNVADHLALACAELEDEIERLHELQ